MIISDQEAVKVLRLYLHSQSVIHMIDELHDSTIMKHEFKREINRTIRFLEPKINALLKNVNSDESQQYADIVNQIDAVTFGLKTVNKIDS